MFVQNMLLFVGAVVVILAGVVAARARRARHRAAGVLREPLVPARVEQGVPRWCATGIAIKLSTLQESLEGVRVVQAFGREDRVHATFSREPNEAQYDAYMHTVWISARYFPVDRVRGGRSVPR